MDDISVASPSSPDGPSPPSPSIRPEQSFPTTPRPSCKANIVSPGDVSVVHDITAFCDPDVATHLGLEAIPDVAVDPLPRLNDDDIGELKRLLDGHELDDKDWNNNKALVSAYLEGKDSTYYEYVSQISKDTNDFRGMRLLFSYMSHQGAPPMAQKIMALALNQPADSNYARVNMIKEATMRLCRDPIVLNQDGWDTKKTSEYGPSFIGRHVIHDDREAIIIAHGSEREYLPENAKESEEGDLWIGMYLGAHKNTFDLEEWELRSCIQEYEGDDGNISSGDDSSLDGVKRLRQCGGKMRPMCVVKGCQKFGKGRANNDMCVGHFKRSRVLPDCTAVATDCNANRLGWKCVKCKTINGMRRKRCKKCRAWPNGRLYSTPVPTDQLSISSEASQQEGWKCCKPSCRKVNSMDKLRCMECQSWPNGRAYSSPVPRTIVTLSSRVPPGASSAALGSLAPLAAKFGGPKQLVHAVWDFHLVHNRSRNLTEMLEENGITKSSSCFKSCAQALQKTRKSFEERRVHKKVPASLKSWVAETIRENRTRPYGELREQQSPRKRQKKTNNACPPRTKPAAPSVDRVDGHEIQQWHDEDRSSQTRASADQDLRVGQDVLLDGVHPAKIRDIDWSYPDEYEVELEYSNGKKDWVGMSRVTPMHQEDSQGSGPGGHRVRASDRQRSSQVSAPNSSERSAGQQSESSSSSSVAAPETEVTRDRPERGQERDQFADQEESQDPGPDGRRVRAGNSEDSPHASASNSSKRSAGQVAECSSSAAAASGTEVVRDRRERDHGRDQGAEVRELRLKVESLSTLLKEKEDKERLYQLAEKQNERVMRSVRLLLKDKDEEGRVRQTSVDAVLAMLLPCRVEM